MCHFYMWKQVRLIFANSYFIEFFLYLKPHHRNTYFLRFLTEGVIKLLILDMIRFYVLLSAGLLHCCACCAWNAFRSISCSVWCKQYCLELCNGELAQLSVVTLLCGRLKLSYLLLPKTEAHVNLFLLTFLSFISHALSGFYFNFLFF